MPYGRIARIGLETDFLHGPMTGVGNYCFHLLTALMEDNQDVEFLGFSGFTWRPLSLADMKDIDRVQGKSAKDGSPTITVPLYKRALKQAIWSAAARHDFARQIYRGIRRLYFQKEQNRGALDLFHAFKYLPLINLDIPVLPVVYDLSFVRFPETHPRERLKELEGLPRVVERAPFVQTISEFSKAEIVDVYGYPAERIIVAPPAASAIFRPRGQEFTRAGIASFDLSPGFYFLSVGTLEPRKNLRTLIAAYAELSPNLRSQYPLVIAGNSGWGELHLPPAASRLLNDGSLRFLGPVDDTKLRSLYEGARALLCPSIYEGFGMPAVEALACGTEVVHSCETSMDEITEGTAVTVSALDVTAWTAAMKKLLEDPAPQGFHHELRLAQSQKYNWHHSASTVKQLYQRIATGMPRRV